MFEEHLLTVRKNTSTVRYMINTSEVLRNTAFTENVSTKLNTQVEAEILSNIRRNIPDIKDWQVYDQCSVVTRLYAIYEGFVEILVKSWLELIPKNIPCYLDLDERIRTTHQIGVGRLLLEQKKTRYENLDIKKIIDSLHNGLNNQEYELTPEAFLFHEQNLRKEILEKLLADAGITNAWNWIDKHRDIIKLLAGIKEKDKTAEEKLNELIIYRNQAAHRTSISDILDYDEMLELCDFIDILCEAITELVTYRFIQYQQLTGQAREIGEITEWFKKQNAGVAKVEATSLSVGASIFLVNEEISYCQPATIISIRINNSPVQQVQTTAGMEVGLKFDIDARRGWRLFQI